MSEKVYLHLLILCGIFSLIIFPTSSDENIKEASNSQDLLLRKKRVLNQEPGEDVTVRIRDFPYVVNIKKSNRISCVGSILSHRTVITAAACVMFHIQSYKVLSGIIRASGGKMHDVTGKKIHFSSSLPRTTSWDGVALITVEPPFLFSRYTNKIDLHAGLILPNTLGTVAGWGGLLRGGETGSSHLADRLRAITVPIMNHQECKNIYRGFANITDKEICTFHPNKYTGHTDVGAALVINNELAGINLWGGRIVTVNKPDVFVLVQHSEYNQWIRENIA